MNAQKKLIVLRSRSLNNRYFLSVEWRRPCRNSQSLPLSGISIGGKEAEDKIAILQALSAARQSGVTSPDVVIQSVAPSSCARVSAATDAGSEIFPASRIPAIASRNCAKNVRTAFWASGVCAVTPYARCNPTQRPRALNVSAIRPISVRQASRQSVAGSGRSTSVSSSVRASTSRTNDSFDGKRV